MKGQVMMKILKRLKTCGARFTVEMQTLRKIVNSTLLFILTLMVSGAVPSIADEIDDYVSGMRHEMTNYCFITHHYAGNSMYIVQRTPSTECRHCNGRVILKKELYRFGKLIKELNYENEDWVNGVRGYYGHNSCLRDFCNGDESR